MKSLAESPAVLTVHQGSRGQYIIRVADLRHRPLVIGVSRLLDDATSLVVITPTDTKVFTVSANGSGPSVEPSVEPEETAPLDADTEAAIADEESRAVPGTPADDIAAAMGAGDASHRSGSQGDPEVVAETAQGTKVIRRKKNPAPTAGHDEACGRCRGEGRIQMLLDGGAPAETACPICKGSGVMRRYGARR